MGYYLRKEENDLPSFLIKGIHKIEATDKSISDEFYNEILEYLSTGKMLKIKNIEGTNLNEIFEEYTLDDSSNPFVEEQNNISLAIAEMYEEFTNKIEELEKRLAKYEGVNTND